MRGIVGGAHDEAQDSDKRMACDVAQCSAVMLFWEALIVKLKTVITSKIAKTASLIK